MALIWLDGFDEYTSATDPSFPYINNGGILQTNNGRYGGGSLYIDSYNYYVTFNFPSNQTEIWLGFAMNNQEVGSSQYVGEFYSTNGTELTVSYAGSTGVWTITGGSTLGTVTKSIGSGSYHWVEFHIKLGSSTGIFEMWIDNAQYCDYTNVNTNSSGGSSLNSWRFGGGNNSQYAYYDDFYVLTTTGGGNTTRLGDSRIETLKPTSDAGPNNGTPSSGSAHYAMVNENQNDGSTSTLTLTNTSGQEELFGMASLSGTPATIFAVCVTNIVEKSDAGTCNGESVISSSSVVSTGTSTPLTTTFSLVNGIFETDPNTSSAWTYSAVNAMKCGFKVP